MFALAKMKTIYQDTPRMHLNQFCPVHGSFLSILQIAVKRIFTIKLYFERHLQTKQKLNQITCNPINPHGTLIGGKCVWVYSVLRFYRAGFSAEPGLLSLPAHSPRAKDRKSDEIILLPTFFFACLSLTL